MTLRKVQIIFDRGRDGALFYWFLFGWYKAPPIDISWNYYRQISMYGMDFATV